MTRSWLAALPLLVLVACAKGEGEGEVKPTASVTTALAQVGEADETLTAYGAAEFAPEAERSLVAPVEAVVAKILAPAGTRVSAGQAVAVLSPSPASALELARAKSDAAAADAAAARAKRLRAAGLVGDAEVETAAAAARTADATLASLSARAGGGLTLRAPAAGVVETIAVDAGATAAQGAVVARIGSLADLRIRLGVEPGQALRLRPGARVRLTPLAGGQATEAAVDSVDPRLDPQTRQAAVRVRAPAGAFAPGEPVRGEILLARHPGAILAPRAAVVFEGDQPLVFTVKAGAAHRREVTLGAASGDRVEVVRGLAGGERIAVDGAAALEDGMAVREVAPAPAGSAGEAP